MFSTCRSLQTGLILLVLGACSKEAPAPTPGTPLVAAAPQTQDAPAPDKSAVELKVREFYASVASKKWQALRACFLPESAWVQPGGIVQKAEEIIAAYEAGKMLGTAEEASKIEVTVYEDVASAWVTSHEASAPASVDKDEPKASGALPGVDLFVLARRDGAWKIASGFISGLKEK